MHGRMGHRVAPREEMTAVQTREGSRSITPGWGKVAACGFCS
jgi:hypothetical protein